LSSGAGGSGKGLSASSKSWTSAAQGLVSSSHVVDTSFPTLSDTVPVKQPAWPPTAAAVIRKSNTVASSHPSSGTVFILVLVWIWFEPVDCTCMEVFACFVIEFGACTVVNFVKWSPVPRVYGAGGAWDLDLDDDDSGLGGSKQKSGKKKSGRQKNVLFSIG
jgi:hypothetical protein